MRILIACGASGGHIFPAIALGASVRARAKGAELLFVCSDRYLDRRIFTREKLAFMCLSSNKLPYRPTLSILAFLTKLVIDIVKTWAILAREKPEVIVGFGGYVSFPVVMVGRLRGVPIVVHEQNVVPGRANAFLFRFADSIALAFPQTLPLLSGRDRKKAVVTGNPIRTEMLRNDREAASKAFGLEGGKFTILVIGGSQGAHNLNKVFAESVSAMDERRRGSLQIIHIAGEKDCAWVRKAYEDSRVANRVFPFIDNIDRAYSAADLVVTRSGAAALFEVAYYAKPMILVPYPYAMSHQKENALVFSGRGAALFAEEKDLSSQKFGSIITELMQDERKLRAMSEASAALSMPDASEALAGVVAAMRRS